MPAGDVARLEPTAVVAGGDALARAADGRAVLVDGALPGEVVDAEVVEDKGSYLRARTVAVLEPSPDRVAPPCPALAAGCGGCGWQHVRRDAQQGLKAAIVADALRRIGRIPEGEMPVIQSAPARAAGSSVPSGHRTTVRAAVDGDGRPSLHRHRSSELVPIDDGCLVAHPLVDDVLRAIRLPGAQEVTVRAGVATGERLALVAPSVPGGATVPAGTAVVGVHELRRRRDAHIHEVVGGRRWRISATSFFQSGPEAAEALVAAVAAALGDRTLRRGSVLVDAYAGVGLFAGAVGGPAGAEVIAVEQHRAAVADAAVNLADVGARVVRAEVARWQPVRADAVIADPARPGLGRSAAATLAGCGAPVLVLVACDPASLARDVGLLRDHGYRLDGVELVDAFPDTPHVEAVARFTR